MRRNPNGVAADPGTLLARAIHGEPFGSLLKRTNEMNETRLLNLRARRGARGNLAILSEWGRWVCPCGAAFRRPFRGEADARKCRRTN